ncbi:MAG: alpha/beta fold hydrolase [Pirellulales bacterium]|nr:alpha/beta fold hydrolase [Pirellulales bacterium]
MIVMTNRQPGPVELRGAYARRPPLVLINGLAEQAESWFANVDYWRTHFDVHQPNLLAYEGALLQRRIDQGLPITVPFFVEQLQRYLVEFVQVAPVCLVASSMGAKIAVEFAVRHPEHVARMVLLCPSGLSVEERLPLVEGVRRNDPRSIVESVFYDARLVDAGLLDYYREKFSSRRWQRGVLRTVRGTMEHRVRELMPRVVPPTLVVIGEEDRIVDPRQTLEAASRLPHGRVQVLPRCGHAPQMELPHVINPLVTEFLTQRGAADAPPRDCALAESVR